MLCYNKQVHHKMTSEVGFLLMFFTIAQRSVWHWSFSPQSPGDGPAVKHAATARGADAAPTSIGPRIPSLLDVDDDDAQRRHQTQSLDPQEPEQQPEEEHDHRFHYSVPKQHVAESQPPQTLIEHPKQSSHSLTVIQVGFSGGLFHSPIVPAPGTGITGGELLSGLWQKETLKYILITSIHSYWPDAFNTNLTKPISQKYTRLLIIILCLTTKSLLKHPPNQVKYW